MIARPGTLEECVMVEGGGRHSRSLVSWCHSMHLVLFHGPSRLGMDASAHDVAQSRQDTAYRDVSRCRNEWRGGTRHQKPVMDPHWDYGWLRSRLAATPTPTIPEDAISEPWAATAL